MQVTLQISPTDALTLREMAEDEAYDTIETYIEGLIELKASIHRLCTEERAAILRCSTCHTINLPDGSKPEYVARTTCCKCGKRLGSKKDAFVSKRRLARGLGPVKRAHNTGDPRQNQAPATI